jgi:hypothetical protein
LLLELLSQSGDHEGNAMQSGSYLMDEMSERAGISHGAYALCCAIIEDAEIAREFEVEPRSAMEMFCVAMLRPVMPHRESKLTPRELTNLIA